MSSSKFILDKSVKMIVCDMAGTTVNEGGLVYKTIYNTVKSYNISIEEEEMKNWYGVNKTEVLQHFINRDPGFRNNEAILPQMLSSFKKNLRKSYFDDEVVKLIDPNMPSLFNRIRNNGVKIALNTGFSIDLQEALLESLNMRDFIDGYISSESVVHGRPEPYMINELMDRFNITDSKSVVKIGDSRADMQEGKNAGCGTTIGVLSGAETKENLLDSGADIVLNSVMEIDIQ